MPVWHSADSGDGKGSGHWIGLMAVRVDGGMVTAALIGLYLDMCTNIRIRSGPGILKSRAPI